MKGPSKTLRESHLSAERRLSKGSRFFVVYMVTPILE